MLRHHLGAAVIAALALLAQSSMIVHAQVPPSQALQRSPVLADIQTSVIRAVGAQAQTVEVTVTGNILTVSRINSNMNESTHGGRDNEARAIGSVVSKAISKKPEFKNLNTIRIQYLSRTAPGDNSKVIDTIDFRKTPGGSFEFHQT